MNFFLSFSYYTFPSTEQDKILINEKELSPNEFMKALMKLEQENLKKKNELNNQSISGKNKKERHY